MREKTCFLKSLVIPTIRSNFFESRKKVVDMNTHHIILLECKYKGQFLYNVIKPFLMGYDFSSSVEKYNSLYLCTQFDC